MGRVKCDHIERLTILTSDNIKRLSLYSHFKGRFSSRCKMIIIWLFSLLSSTVHYTIAHITLPMFPTKHCKPHSKNFGVEYLLSKVLSLIIKLVKCWSRENTVETKLMLTTTSELRPPVYRAYITKSNLWALTTNLGSQRWWQVCKHDSKNQNRPSLVK
jgi:hypothetical protein